MIPSWCRSFISFDGKTKKKKSKLKRGSLLRKFRTAPMLEELESRIVPAGGTAKVYLNLSTSLTQSTSVSAARSNVVPVFIDFATVTQGTNGGIGVGSFYVVYDPTQLSISQSAAGPGSDIKLGSLLTSSGLGYSVVNASTGSTGYETGVVALSLNHSGSSFMTGSPTGHLLEIDFHVLPSIGVSNTTLLDLQAEFNDGFALHSTFMKDKGNIGYSLQEPTGSTSQYATLLQTSRLTQPGALTPATLTPADGDGSDAVIQIVEKQPGLAPKVTNDALNTAPNTPNFAATANVPASAGVKVNDTGSANGAEEVFLTSTGVSTIGPSVTGIQSISEATDPVSGITTATVALESAGTYIPGESVSISQVTTAGYNGNFAVSSVSDSTHFSFINATAGLGLLNDGGTGTPIGEVVAQTTLTKGTTAQGGAVILNAQDGSYAYTPPSGFTGSDSFLYQGRDAVSDMPSATSAVVNITVGGLVTIPQNISAIGKNIGDTIDVPIMILNPNPANSGGLANITLGINYDANVLTLTNGTSDVAEGSIPTAAGWGQFTAVNANNDPNKGPGEIVITTSDTGGASPILTTGGGSLAVITFHILAMPVGSLTTINLSAVTPAITQLAVAGTGTPVALPFAFAPMDNTNFNFNATRITDGEVIFDGVTQTSTSITSSNASAVYGSVVTFSATVVAQSGSTGPGQGSVDFFDVTANHDLGNGTFRSTSGLSSSWTFATGIKTFNVTSGDVIRVTYTPSSGFGGSNSAANGDLIQAITPRPITVTAATNTKIYDSLATAAAVPTITGTLVTGDTAAFTEAYDNRNVGTGKTLAPAGSVSDGNSGHNYSVTLVSDTSGQISARSLTVTAVTFTKQFDGTITAPGAHPTLTGTLAGNDTAGFTETFDTADPGTGKTLTPSGSVSDGNSGKNYAYSFQTDTTGAITGVVLTSTIVGANVGNAAVTTVTYGTQVTLTALVSASSGSGLPSVGTVDFKDGSIDLGLATSAISAPNHSELFTLVTGVKTFNVGDGVHVITATYHDNVDAVFGDSKGTLQGGLGVTARPITVTASTNTRAYDGTTSASAAPTVSSGTLVSGDSAGFTESYDTKNAGTGKTLIPAGSVSDGNHGQNYAVTFANDLTGAIIAANLTVTAKTNTKTYDGTTSAAASPAITGSIATGDTPHFLETYDNSQVGTGKTLTPAGSVSDGNSGNNYSINFVSDSTGQINDSTTARQASLSLSFGTTNSSGKALAAARSAVVFVYIDFATISAGPSGGIGVGSFYVVYDPTELSISQTSAGPGTDIKLGSLVSTSGLGYSVTNASTGATGYETGVVAVSLNHVGTSFVTGSATGHLLELDFHVLPTVAQGNTTLLDLQTSFNDGLLFHDSFIKDKGNTSYNLQPPPSGYATLYQTSALTQAGALTPGIMNPTDHDTADAAIQIVAKSPNIVPVPVGDSYSDAPNNGSFAATMNVPAAAGVKINDNPTVSPVSQGPEDVLLAGDGITTTPASIVSISALSETTDAVSGITTATVVTSSSHVYMVGQQIAISSATIAGYNGQFAIASIIDGTHFTFVNPTTGLSPITGSGVVIAQTTITGGKSAHGGAVLLNESDGSFAYTPPTGFVGTDIFAYQGRDALSNAASTNNATVTITVGGLLTIPQNIVPVAGLVTVPINLLSPNPANSGGLANATLGINYDASKLSLSSTADVAPGSLVTAAGWSQFTVANPNNDPAHGPGQIIITTSDTGGASPMIGTAGGSLAVITFHVVGAPVGISVINLSAATPAITQLAVAGTGTPVVLPLAVAPADNTHFNNPSTRLTDGEVIFSQGVPTATALTSSNTSVIYGSLATFSATVVAQLGTTAPTAGGVDFFDVTTSTDLGNGTFKASSGVKSVWNFVTAAKTFNVTSGDVIRATYVPGAGFFGSDSSTNGDVTIIVKPRALTVSANKTTKTYDGTTASDAKPSIIGTIVQGDTAAFTETYNSRDVHSGKTLTPAGSVNDGNSGHNYSLTFVSDTRSAIVSRAITVTAIANTKLYDGTTAAGATPQITGGSLATGDTVTSFIETYANPGPGVGIRLIPSGTVFDGNNGHNYSYTFVSTNSGAIDPPNASIAYKTGYASVMEPPAGQTAPYFFTISLDAVSSQAVTVYVSTKDITATAGADYTGLHNLKVTFPAFAHGDTPTTPPSQDITVSILPDHPDGKAPETFVVALTVSYNSRLSSAFSTAVGTILEPPAPPPATVTVANLSKDAPTSGTLIFYISVTLSAPAAQDLTLYYSTADGTAVSPTNYLGRTNVRLTIPQGQTTVYIPIKVFGAQGVHASKTFTVTVSDPTGNILAGPSTATVTIGYH